MMLNGDYDPVEPEASMPDQDDEPTPEEADEYLTMQVLLPRGDGYQRATVAHRKRDADGNPIGIRNNNPILDTRVYEVEFEDGAAVELAANAVANALFDSTDPDGNEFLVFKEILDHKKTDQAVRKEDGWIEREGRAPQRKRTTKGWKLLIQWADGLQTWENLSDIKESYPLDVAEYAAGNQIIAEPAFAWWCPLYLKKRRAILRKLKTRYWRKTHKYGIEIPHTVEEAREIDKRNGNTLWSDAMDKEMSANAVTFKILENMADGRLPDAPKGYKKIRVHMIFDVKLEEGFRRKARLVADGQMLDSPRSMTYASVVSRDTVRIALTLAALNGCDVLVGDVKAAYLNAKPTEKAYFIAGKEFGMHEGKLVVIIRALYGLKGSGAAWAKAMRAHMRGLGFKPCLADKDLWMRVAVDTSKPSVEDESDSSNQDAQLIKHKGTAIVKRLPAGERYYEYTLIHTDDCMVISRRAKEIMEAIDAVYKLKKDKKTGKCYSEPSTYLGTKIRKYRSPDADENDPYCWSWSGDDYIKDIVEQCERKLKAHGRQLNAKQTSPLTPGYRPELDTSPELTGESWHWYNELVGQLRWGIELGRGDIITEVSLMSSHLALPRRGHLDQVLNIFAYLKYILRSKLVLNPAYMNIKEEFADRFNDHAEWFEFYGDVKEEIPDNAPTPYGKPVETTGWVDADHAGDRLTRRSHTGVLLFINSAPIIWYSKKQATIESATFGSEMVALRTALALVKDLRYKLRMMRVPLIGPTLMFGDNKSVVNSASIPEHKITKKHLGICYHAVREAAAQGIWRVGWCKSAHNIANSLTKILSGTVKEKEINKWMYR